MYSPWETHLDGQKYSSFQLEDNTLQLQMDCLSPQTSCEQIIYLTPIILIFRATDNTPKSYTMQKMLGENAHKCNMHGIRIDKS